MTLIFILLALGLDFFLGGLQQIRNFSWVNLFHSFLERRLAHYKYWDGCAGLLVVITLPIAGLVSVLLLLNHWSWIAEAVFTLLVLVYCLAPAELDTRLGDYITAMDTDNADDIAVLTESITINSAINAEDTDEQAIIKSAFIESHKRGFAVLFWFLLLGVVGAILYRMVDELDRRFSELHGGLPDSTHILLSILEWPSSRLYIIGLALAGNLVEAFSGWKKSERFSVDVNDRVLIDAGYGALHYSPGSEISGREKYYWIDELKALINRTLIIWLAVLGIMTISGRLG